MCGENQFAASAWWPAFIERVKEFGSARGLYWKLIGQAMGVGLLGVRSLRSAVTAEMLVEFRGTVEALGGLLVILRCPPELKGHIDVWPAAGDGFWPWSGG